MEQSRRRNRLVVAFPDGQPCLKLAAADYATRWNNMVGQVLLENAATLPTATSEIDFVSRDDSCLRGNTLRSKLAP